MLVERLRNNKRIVAVIIAMIAVVIILSGTYAWNSFTQQRINTFEITVTPGVNLHDDFAGGPEKDVYVENSGEKPVLVRIRLTELLIRQGIQLPDVAKDDEQGTDWHVHVALDGACEVCDFAAHEYFSWVMSGQKFYMPAPKSAWGDEETEPLAVGDLDEIIDYADLLMNAFAGDQFLLTYIDEYLSGNTDNADYLQNAIAALPDSLVVPQDVRQYDGQDTELTRKLNEVRLTLIPKQIMTMENWLTTKQPGDFWVMDTDGWCYWANALQPKTATGQLLSEVIYNNNYSGDDLTYRINVTLNATTFGGADLDDFFELAATTGGITENAEALMFMASGGYIPGADGELYANNGNGYFQKVEKIDGIYVLGNPFYAGADGIPGNEDDVPYAARYFYHIGNGVYVEAADKNGTTPKDDPITYYFAGVEKITENQKENPNHPYYSASNEGGADIQTTIDTLFPLQLTVGEYFDIILAEDEGGAYIDQIVKGGSVFVMSVLELDENDDLYIPLDGGGKISVGANGILGRGMDAEGGASDGSTFTLSRPSGSGTQSQQFEIRTRADMDWVSEQTGLGNLDANTYLKIADDVTVLQMGSDLFTPIGTGTVKFDGQFDGNNKIIDGLKIERATTHSGLFGCVGTGGNVKNLALTNVSIDCTSYYVGGIAGLNNGTIENCSVSGTITGTSSVGGVAGTNDGGTLLGCSNSATITGAYSSGGGFGGLAGGNRGGAKVISCYSTGDVSSTFAGSSRVGGVVGDNSGSNTKVERSYSIGDVSGVSDSVGGVVGYNDSNAAIENCYATGDVTGGSYNIGGIVGINGVGGNASVTKSYHAFGTIKSTYDNANTGAIVGTNKDFSTFSYSVAYSSVIGSANGKTAAGAGNLSNCHTYNVTGGTGSNNLVSAPDEDWWKTTVNFDFDAIWTWDGPNNLPVLRMGDGA